MLGKAEFEFAIVAHRAQESRNVRLWAALSAT